MQHSPAKAIRREIQVETQGSSLRGAIRQLISESELKRPARSSNQRPSSSHSTTLIPTALRNHAMCANFSLGYSASCVFIGGPKPFASLEQNVREIRE